MRIIVRDNQGCGMSLMMEGYSQEQIAQAKQQIRQDFADAAKQIFETVLGKEAPDTIVIDLAQSDNEELEGERAASLASFDFYVSARTDQLVFTVREKTVIELIKCPDNANFKNVVLHELIHAADFPIIMKCAKMFEDLEKAINEEFAQNGDENNANTALFSILDMLNHYRAEGIAILGAHLLLRSQFQSLPDPIPIQSFFAILQLKLANPINSSRGQNYLDEGIYQMAYLVTPSVLLMVLGEKGLVDENLVQKAIEGLQTGCYDLTDDEINTIIKSALSLSLSDYIQGVILMGGYGAPVKDILKFCAMLQQDWDKENINAFARLVTKPESQKVFNKTMKRIMGCVIPEDEIDEYYQAFSADAYPQLKEKVDKLYFVLKNDEDPNKKRIAQWTLTYLFDEEDVIHDNIAGFGLTDDMVVIDYALRLIEVN